jgi:hypothetical protein
MSVARESTSVLAIVGVAMLFGCGGSTFAPGDVDGGEHDAATIDAGHGGHDAGADSGKGREAGASDANGAHDGGSNIPDASASDGPTTEDANAPDSTIPDAAAPDAPTDSGRDSSSVSSTPCPMAAPTAGLPCSVTALECEYGSDPSVACDTLVTCVSPVWHLDHGPATSGCNTTNSATCPVAFADVPVGTSCAGGIGLSCDYPQARCDCRVSPPLATLQWDCNTPDETGCPLPRPRIGSACSMDGESCDYGYCSGGVTLLCSAGTWVTGGGVCPG